MQIKNNKIVTLDYILKDGEGQVIDSSEGREDFVYLHGASNIVPGLEKALTGKKVGVEFDVSVSPEEGYGTRNEELVDEVPRAMFDGNEVQLGMQFHAETPAGEKMIVSVIEFDDEIVKVDGNHPLSGAVLDFTIKVVGIRDASEEEINHGHAHQSGGACSH
ncbi:FKBP-type peptidyl-prolyl cis-trans isomerase SlyD [hydrothermal vent metagenome]|uniref:peptidylprolyl isomerase n=1 Tax=hydrothermal vent metagenome TaxID=652676 RepID=A0A3B0Z1V6_9ZZZZ